MSRHRHGTIKNYGVWLATLTNFESRIVNPGGHGNPHVDLKFDDDKGSYSCAVNVKSQSAADHRLVYWFLRQFSHEETDSLGQLQRGFTPLTSANDPVNKLALDFVRDGLVKIPDGRVLDSDDLATGPDDDILNVLLPILQSAKDRAADMYIFGSQFPHHDGIHDVHMNQGSPGFENATHKDGAILFHFTDDDHWEGIFLAFASQLLPTDDHTGLPLSDAQTLAQILNSPLPGGN